MSAEIVPTAIPAVKLVTPRRFADARGFFAETWRADWLPGRSFVQDNHSLSRAAGTVRGLHFQLAPSAQGKLLRVVRGAVLDVAVDIRRGSPSYGRHVAVELSAENGRQLWIPPGFAHGFCTLLPDTEVLYKVTAPYDPAADRGLAWDDPALGIAWPDFAGAAEGALSDKDRRHPALADLPPCFAYDHYPD
ncbi:MAG TPA: dTDP-4-dehydrorhamnose 3,5-epimerase [Alphaproteobacteria bacterium]|nr:dTDP-4-dehydrorhamnose 3,5-epimerase [Alphaproteobacteria bacterium]